MTLGIGTLSTRGHQPVRVISAVYPVQTREQRRLLARNASHAGRLVAIGLALVITAFAVFAAGGSSSDAHASSGGLPLSIELGTPQTLGVPEARSATLSATCANAELRSGLCIVSFSTQEVSSGSEGRA